MQTPRPGPNAETLGIGVAAELHDGYCSASVAAVVGFLNQVNHVRLALMEVGVRLADAQCIQEGHQIFGLIRVDNTQGAVGPDTESSELSVMPVVNRVHTLLEASGAIADGTMAFTGVAAHAPKSNDIVQTVDDAAVEQSGASPNPPDAGSPPGSYTTSTAATSEPGSHDIENRPHAHAVGPAYVSSPDVGTPDGDVDEMANGVLQKTIDGEAASLPLEPGHVATAEMSTDDPATALPSSTIDQQQGSVNRPIAGGTDPDSKRIRRKVAAGPTSVLLNGVPTAWSSTVSKPSGCQARKTPTSVTLEPVGSEVHLISSDHRRYHPEDAADASAVEAGNTVIVESCSTEHVLFAGRDALTLQRKLDLPEDPSAS